MSSLLLHEIVLQRASLDHQRCLLQKNLVHGSGWLRCTELKSDSAGSLRDSNSKRKKRREQDAMKSHQQQRGKTGKVSQQQHTHKAPAKQRGKREAAPANKKKRRKPEKHNKNNKEGELMHPANAVRCIRQKTIKGKERAQKQHNHKPHTKNNRHNRRRPTHVMSRSPKVGALTQCLSAS